MVRLGIVYKAIYVGLAVYYLLIGQLLHVVGPSRQKLPISRDSDVRLVGISRGSAPMGLATIGV